MKPNGELSLTIGIYYNLFSSFGSMFLLILVLYNNPFKVSIGLIGGGVSKIMQFQQSMNTNRPLAISSPTFKRSLG